jgi:hypothetical protein
MSVLVGYLKLGNVMVLRFFLDLAEAYMRPRSTAESECCGSFATRTAVGWLERTVRIVIQLLFGSCILPSDVCISTSKPSMRFTQELSYAGLLTLGMMFCTVRTMGELAIDIFGSR